LCNIISSGRSFIRFWGGGGFVGDDFALCIRGGERQKTIITASRHIVGCKIFSLFINSCINIRNLKKTKSKINFKKCRFHNVNLKGVSPPQIVIDNLISRLFIRTRIVPRHVDFMLRNEIGRLLLFAGFLDFADEAPEGFVSVCLNQSPQCYFVGI